MSGESSRLLESPAEDASDQAPTPQPAMQSLYSPMYGSTPILTEKVEEGTPSVETDDQGDDVILEHGLTASMDRGSHTTSDAESLMHLLKGNIGTGILAMPVAIHKAGLWVGTVGLVVIGVIALHCMSTLVRCSRFLCEKTGRPSLDYGTVAKKAVENYFYYLPRQKRIRIGKTSKVIVNTFLCITQFGFCTVYILFVAQNVEQVVKWISGWDASVRVYETFVFILLIPYVFVRKLSHLAPFSLVANLLTVAGLLLTLQFCFRDLPPGAAGRLPAFSSWQTLPMYFGLALYAFEGIGVVLPIENKMKNPHHYTGWFGVLNTGMYIVVIMYIAVGFYGYLKFENDVLPSITLNLPNEWLYMAVRLMFSIGIYISHALQFYVPILLMTTALRRKVTNLWLKDHIEILLRLAFLVLTFLLAISIPRLDLMISLIGAMASSALALIFPPMIEFFTFWPEKQIGGWTILKQVLICTFGVVGFIAGTTTTVIQLFSSSDQS